MYSQHSSSPRGVESQIMAYFSLINRCFFSRGLLSAQYKPGIVKGSGDTAENKKGLVKRKRH